MYIENLVEMHCHILPAIDDGSRDVETSLKMIERLQQQGAHTIVLTPHYYSNEISLDDFLRRRDRAFNKLLNALPPGSPRLIPAAEVYISDYLFNNESIKEICIGNSEYALIEHSFSSEFDEKVYDRLMNLYCDYGIRPVLAHIERYPALINDKYKLDAYIKMGCLTQVNVNSFANAPLFLKKKLLKYASLGKIDLIGSDCHNLESRPPEYKAGVEALIKKCGQETVDRMIKNANKLISK